jgi:hypothetical protein
VTGAVLVVALADFVTTGTGLFGAAALDDGAVFFPVGAAFFPGGVARFGAAADLPAVPARLGALLSEAAADFAPGLGFFDPGFFDAGFFDAGFFGGRDAAFFGGRDAAFAVEEAFRAGAAFFGGRAAAFFAAVTSTSFKVRPPVWPPPITSVGAGPLPDIRRAGDDTVPSSMQQSDRGNLSQGPYRRGPELRTPRTGGAQTPGSEDGWPGPGRGTSSRELRGGSAPQRYSGSVALVLVGAEAPVGRISVSSPLGPVPLLVAAGAPCGGPAAGRLPPWMTVA